MTDNEIKIAIAEACGHKWYWRVNGSNDAGFIWFLRLAYPPEEGIGTHWKGCAGETRAATEAEIVSAKASGAFENYSPNYPDDLNAIAQARKILTRDQQEIFAHELSQLVPQNYNCGPIDKGEEDIMVHTEFDLIDADARKQSTAFLRTLTLWREEKKI